MTRALWQVASLSGGWMSVDGGTLFGIVPKMIWGKLIRADRRNCVRIPCRCLLARRGKETVLIDTGYGGKGGKARRRGMALEAGNPILGSLAQLGVLPQDVTHVVMTHLHFDHAGGATRPDEKGNIVPAFPRALYWASGAEWRDAIRPIPALRRAYPQENLLPLAERNLTRSFEDGDEILPGISVRITGGHTRGHATVQIRTRKGPVLFIGELVPTHWHARELWTSAFDLFPLESRVRKPEIFARVLEEKMPIYWSHDPDAAASRAAGRKGNDLITEKIL